MDLTPEKSKASPSNGTGIRHRLQRSITETGSPSLFVQTGPSSEERAPRHPHRHLHYRLHRRDRSRDDKLSGSPHPAVPTTQSRGRASFDVFRSEGATPNTMSPEQSRRGSMLVPQGVDGAETQPSKAEIIPARTREEELRLGKAAAEARDAALQSSMDDLSTFATDIHQQLDDTYYSVLDKLSTLQGTLESLRELAVTSTALEKSFTQDAEALITDSTRQLDAFGNFEEQEARINSLQGRVQFGRDKTQVLSNRLAKVLSRIEGWERADQEWQEHTRKRLKVIWIIIAVLGGVFLLVYIGAGYVTKAKVQVLHEEAMAAIREHMGDLGDLMAGEGAANASTFALNFTGVRLPTDLDDRLRELDEL